ncbi:MAG TPA: hypothetical protein VIH76_12835 [Candidatus Acidoferrales bacterium]
MNMGPTYSVSPFTLVLIFAAGVAVGRLFRPTKIDLVRTLMPSSSFGAKRIKILKVKCQCGEELEFRDPPDPSHPDYLPFPAGNSVTCPKCGRTFDLAGVRADGPKEIPSD